MSRARPTASCRQSSPGIQTPLPSFSTTTCLLDSTQQAEDPVASGFHIGDRNSVRVTAEAPGHVLWFIWFVKYPHMMEQL
eukprot:4661250-Pleurochrysis_carterae.AAC.4